MLVAPKEDQGHDGQDQQRHRGDEDPIKPECRSRNRGDQRAADLAEPEEHAVQAHDRAAIVRVRLGHVRKQARELRAVSRVGGQALLDDASLERITERIDAERSTRALYRSLDALPAKQRAVVELVAVDGLSLAEAAAALGIAPGAARTRYHRARTRLRTELRTELCEVTP